MSESTASLICLNNIRFGWKKGDADLINLERFVLSTGEKVFISGPSGCGKSTLLSLISGIALPRSGTIEMLGHNMIEMSTAQRDSFRADHQGIIFQLFNLVPYLTILENVLLPCRFSKVRYDKACQDGLTIEQEARRLLDRLELNLAKLGNQPAVELSIGQQQRVAVARALIGSPDLIIADEPTSALDEGTSQRFIELLLAESKNSQTGIIFVSHDKRLAGQFDRHVKFESVNSIQ